MQYKFHYSAERQLLLTNYGHCMTATHCLAENILENYIRQILSNFFYTAFIGLSTLNLRREK